MHEVQLVAITLQVLQKVPAESQRVQVKPVA
jgi:hypothetical protein